MLTQWPKTKGQTKPMQKHHQFTFCLVSVLHRCRKILSSAALWWSGEPDINCPFEGKIKEKIEWQINHHLLSNRYVHRESAFFVAAFFTLAYLSYFILMPILGQKLTKHNWKDLIKSAVSDSFEYHT